MKICAISYYYIGANRHAVLNWPVGISAEAHVELVDKVVSIELVASAVSGPTYVDICTYSLHRANHTQPITNQVSGPQS